MLLRKREIHILPRAKLPQGRGVAHVVTGCNVASRLGERKRPRRQSFAACDGRHTEPVAFQHSGVQLDDIAVWQANFGTAGNLGRGNGDVVNLQNYVTQSHTVRREARTGQARHRAAVRGNARQREATPGNARLGVRARVKTQLPTNLLKDFKTLARHASQLAERYRSRRQCVRSSLAFVKHLRGFILNGKLCHRQRLWLKTSSNSSPTPQNHDIK